MFTNHELARSITSRLDLPLMIPTFCYNLLEYVNVSNSLSVCSGLHNCTLDFASRNLNLSRNMSNFRRVDAADVQIDDDFFEEEELRGGPGGDDDNDDGNNGDDDVSRGAPPPELETPGSPAANGGAPSGNGATPSGNGTPASDGRATRSASKRRREDQVRWLKPK